MRGYLLIELLSALILVTISITTFAYYRYYKANIQNDALNECCALSLARNELERSANQTSEREYSDGIFTISPTRSSCGLAGEHQKQLCHVTVEVKWTGINGTQKSVLLTTIV